MGPWLGPTLHLGLWLGAWAFATLRQLLSLEQRWTPFGKLLPPALCWALWVPGLGSAWAPGVDRPTGWRARLAGRQTPQVPAQPLAHPATPPPVHFLVTMVTSLPPPAQLGTLERQGHV